MKRYWVGRARCFLLQFIVLHSHTKTSTNRMYLLIFSKRNHVQHLYILECNYTIP